MNDCIFCKIIEGKIPAKIVHEDERMVIFADIAPKAAVHLLLVPRQHYKNITELDSTNASILAQCLNDLSGLVDKLGLEDGFRLVINNGKNAHQLVPHLHVHILGGEDLGE